MKKYILLLFCALATTLSAQNIQTLSGTVVDESNEPLIGVSISVKGTTNGTSTDLDGKYTLNNVPSNGRVVFSMIGFNMQEVPVNGQTTLNIQLKEKTLELDDVVVIGYGVVKKSDLTSSITTVKGDELKSIATGNALNSLQGKANGVQITSEGGPGATPRVIIRGITSINGSDPLYVVDGVPLGTNINFLNQNDIQSMEILKDASAAAIYGTRGSNGVIIITTKKGKAGKTTIQFNSSVGFQTIRKPSLAGAEQYEKVFKERFTNDQSTPVWNSENNLKNSDGTDWWDQTVNDYALMQSYNISFQGGSDKTVYSGSVGYFRQDSQFDVGYWERLTARFNSEYIFNSIVKVGIDFNPRYESWDDTPKLFGAIMRMDPTTPVYKAESEWSVTNPLNNYARSYNNQDHNPVGSIARQNVNSQEYGLIMNPYINIEPIKGLVLRSQFGVNARFRMNNSFSPKFFIHDLEKNDLSKSERTSNHWIDWNWTNTANYMKTFNNVHNLNVMGGFTMEKFSEYWLKGSREAIPSNLSDLQYPSAGTLNPQASGTDVYNTLISYLGRVMYNYDNRYYFTGSIRVDGSSKFPSQSRYATFPAASAAWNINGEEFMKEQKIFDILKLRFGWGRVGNQSIDPAAYLNLVGASDYVYGLDGDRYIGTSISQVGNSKLKWETVEDYNIGLDMSVLDNRLTVTADVFRKKSKDMLMKQENLLVLGYPMWNGEMWTNIGSLEATGWELSLNWKDAVQQVNYEVGINLSSVKNKAKKFADGSVLWRQGFFNDFILRNEIGGELSRFYGYVADGIFQSWTDVYAHTDQHGDLIQADAQPGDIRFRDSNGDGVLNEKDKKYLGSAFPDLMIGLNAKVAYKNFDLIANFYGTMGNDVYNSAKGGFYSGAGGQNVFKNAYDKAWRGEGTSNKYPRLSVNDSNLNYRTISSFFVEDGSYLRCKLLQLGYTLPKDITKGIGVRFTVSAQNLFTITDYSGMDPERAALGGALDAGVDNIGYPNPRTFLFGVNVNF